MMNPKVTIITAVYNTENYLKDCVESVINQTYCNLELILVDDGSTDSSGEICDEYAKKDSRIKVLHIENGRQGHARNKGIDIATGDYFFFLDSDDFIGCDFFEKAINLCISHDLDVLYAPMNTFNDRQSNYKIEDNCIYSSTIQTGIDFLSTNIEYIEGCVPTLFIRSDTVGQTRYIEHVFYEDNSFFFEVLIKAKRLFMIDEGFYYRRIRTGSVMTTSNNVNAVEGYFANILHLANAFDQDKSTETSDLVNRFIQKWFICALAHYKKLTMSERIRLRPLVEEFKQKHKKYALMKSSSISNFCNFGVVYILFSRIMDIRYK